MSAVHKLITDHLDIWTAADTEKKSGRGRASGNANSVYGIKKLRELILELAVRGKLVPQDPNDEPASDLLKRILTQKAKLIAEGKIKKDKPLATMAEGGPFELPPEWLWVRIGDVATYVQRGKGPDYAEASDFEVVSQKCVRWTGLDLTQTRFINPESISKYEPIRLLKKGDILWNSTGTGTIGRACLVPQLQNERILVADSHVTVVRTIELLEVFLWRWIQSPSVQSEIEGVASGTTNQIELNTSTVVSHPLPLPPLKEQHRIVAKVDELMALCDQLEAQHNNAADAHEQLVSHLLSTLTQSQDAEDFNANWQRIATHFDALFTTESSIDALKQTLLQLAVMGKLVPQDPNDEPAGELIQRIRTEKTKLVSDGRIKKEKSFSKIGENEKPFELPSNWQWVRFGEINTIRSELVRPEDFLEFRQVAPDCIEKGTGHITENRTVAESGIRGPNSRFYKGQIIYSKIRPSLSKAALVDFDGLCSADMYPIDTHINSSFMLKQILSECFLEQVRVAENRIKMPKLNMESLTAFILAIPPLEEQRRIVTKTEELIAICDQLKSRIENIGQHRQKIADILVIQALSRAVRNNI